MRRCVAVLSLIPLFLGSSQISSAAATFIQESGKPSSSAPVERAGVQRSGQNPAAGQSGTKKEGLGQAAVKERTATETAVPDEAAALANAMMNKVSPILQGLRESGRLNWKMGELEDDVLLLNWEQEQFLVQLSFAIEGYILKVKQTRDEIESRTGLVQGSAIYDYLLNRILEGQIVHRKLRIALAGGMFSATVPGFHGFCEVDKLGTVEHPLFQIRYRLVTLNMRRSDLFYMLAAYRLITEDYSNQLLFERHFDNVMAVLDMTERSTRDEAYLPRKHRAKYRAMYEGKDAEGFVTTELRPLHRDDLKEMREQLDKEVDKLILLLGKEWADFDFKEAPIHGDDSYFTERALLEELESRTTTTDLKAFRELMARITSAGTVDAAFKIASEVLPEKDAKQLANYVISSSPDQYNKPYTGPDEAFRVDDLSHSLRLLYQQMGGEGLRKLLDNPPPEDLVRAVGLFSEGAHLLVDGKKEEALQKFKAANGATKLSDRRRKSLASFCKKNGFESDAKTFWPE